jgi:hypothetical protein
MAALRTLVLPFGTLTGTRIVLDGVNGRISLFDATDAEVIREDAATAAITVGSQTTGSRIVMDGDDARLSAYDAGNAERVRLDAAAASVIAGSMTTGTRVVISGADANITGYDAANFAGALFDAPASYVGARSDNGSSAAIRVVGGQAKHTAMPPTTAGRTWDNGGLMAGVDTHPYAEAYSPIEEGATKRASLTLYGGLDDDDASRALLTADWTQVSGYATLYNGLQVQAAATEILAGLDVTGTITMRDPVELENGRAAISGNSATETQTMQFGSTVATTNASGDIQCAPGLTTLRGFVAWNGDGAARANMVIANNRGLWPVSGSQNVGVRCWDGDTGAALASTAVRVDWIAFGAL